MKRVRTPVEPTRFRQWREENPTATWAEFTHACRGPEGELYEVRRSLSDAQRGLCAYCESELKPPRGAEVEHFYPKSKRTEEHNWGLDFGNLLAACEGGTKPKEFPDRSGHPVRENLHCGASKQDFDQPELILDPRRIPLMPILWIVDDGGEIGVDERACAEAGVDLDRAEKTLTLLGLNAPVLRRLRKAVRSAVKRLHSEAWDGSEADELPAWERVADQIMPPDPRPLEFWTTVRLQLGPAAERYLQEHPDDW